ncbi:hypothetical protein BLX41_30950 [Pseudomonas protegens]|nr:hypothetical protein BLX41_30950 [Pseudomonas protegens]
MMPAQDEWVHEQMVDMTSVEVVLHVVLLGAGATVVMDLWMLLMKAFGVGLYLSAVVITWASK